MNHNARHQIVIKAINHVISFPGEFSSLRTKLIIEIDSICTFVETAAEFIEI